MDLKRNVTYLTAWCILSVCFVSLTVVMFFVDRTLFLVSLALTVFILLLFTLKVVAMKRTLTHLLSGVVTETDSTPKTILAGMDIPALVTDSNNCVLWYNSRFKEEILGGGEALLDDVSSAIPGFDIMLCRNERGYGYTIRDDHYTVYSSGMNQDDDIIFISLFTRDTAQYKDAVQFKKTRPSVLVCTVDNYEELGRDSLESERAEIMTEVYRMMENFINSTNGIFARISARNYIAIIEEQHIEQIIADRFSVLDRIRGIPTGSIPVTLSIGIGRGAKTLFENHILARQALDMALGRGGDQAAMKTKNGYEFFGGETRAVEKRNKVKSRIIASALCDLIKAARNVVIMGHKNSDLDSLGCSMGLAYIARQCGANVNIAFDEKTTMALPLYDKLVEAGYGHMFITPNAARDYVGSNTLLIVVDCHVASLTENAELLDRTSDVVLIDHHRKMVGYIENAVLTYHEPSSSSCSELVSELMQHIPDADEKPTPLEAVGMLAGIMLDTKDFTVRTGVRTFEAASYLRGLGAETTVARRMFSTDLETYMLKSELVSSAIIYRGCAIVATERMPEDMKVVVPQAADDLLNIEGVSASIVAVRIHDEIRVSARSLGAYNVQLLMEHLGGGGHQTMAGVQLNETDLDKVTAMIKESIDLYLDGKQEKESTE